MQKIKDFFASKAGQQIYSFVKTYVVVFLTLYLFGIDDQGKEMFDLLFIGSVAKYSLLSSVRNIYKLLTEKQNVTQ